MAYRRDKSRSRRRAGLIGLAALLLPALRAGLASSEAEAPASPWRVMAGDGSYFESDCIGSNETPECLAESALACQVQAHHGDIGESGEFWQEICFGPGSPGAGGDLTDLPGWSVDRWLIYRLESWTLSEEDIGELWLEDEPYNTWRPGDRAVSAWWGLCLDSRGGDECQVLRAEDPRWRPGDPCPGLHCYGRLFENVGHDLPDRVFVMREFPRSRQTKERWFEGWWMVDPYIEEDIPYWSVLWRPGRWLDGPMP